MAKKHQVIVETEISDRIPSDILELLAEAAKVCKVDIWVVTPSDDEDLDEPGYGSGV